MSHTALQLDVVEGTDSDVRAGALVSEQALCYPIENGVPDFTYPSQLPEIAVQTRAEYDAVADEIYDNAVDWLFASMLEDEDSVREEFVDRLDLQPGHRVLEIGSGTGRDTFRIARRLGENGELFIQDLSPRMVFKSMETMSAQSALTCKQRFFISDATYLPFADGYFDAVFHFGGFNQFPQKTASLLEFARVTKKGGKIVFGDEAVAPWLRNTEFAAIVTTNNPLFDYEVPLESLPLGAREVGVRWVLGNCFYLIDFRVGEGPPPLDIDLPHAGRRGGTMRTRYFGQLEGVTPDTKIKAGEAAARRGKSMHAWLEEAVRTSAEEDLGR